MEQRVRQAEKVATELFKDVERKAAARDEAFKSFKLKSERRFEASQSKMLEMQNN